MSRWVRVTKVIPTIRANLYVRYKFYKEKNSVHLKAFKKEGNKLFIDLEYFEKILKKNEELKKKGQANYYKLLDIYGNDYQIALALEKFAGVDRVAYYNFMNRTLFREHEQQFRTEGSYLMPSFVKETSKMLGEI